jgi:hypothetical protein
LWDFPWFSYVPTCPDQSNWHGPWRIQRISQPATVDRRHLKHQLMVNIPLFVVFQPSKVKVVQDFFHS